MNLYNKLKNSIIGDDEKGDDHGYKLPKAKFEKTKWANCIVTPTDEDTLAMNKAGLDSISKHFSNMISLVGPPGVGKSTLSSAIYNVQRRDKNEYFEASSEAMESFTRGIWALNEHTKCIKGDCDKVNVLDLEGIDDEDVIHYLVVVGMALSKAILLCANYTVNPRFQFTMFKTLESGVRIFKQNNIRVPKPIIYIQVPHGMTQFKIRSGTVDKNGLFVAIKKKYKILQDFEMRIFSLPSFKNKNRFDNNYLNAVKGLIEEFKGIKEQVATEDRVKYAYGVAAALNSGSPSIVHDMNTKFFKNEIKLRSDNIKANAISILRNKAGIKGKEITDKNMSFAAFCRLVCPDGKYYYGQEIKQQALQLAYYDENNNQIVKVVSTFEQKNFFIDPMKQCKDIYDKAMVDLHSKLIAKGDEYMKLHADTFRSFVDLEVANAKNKIRFNGSTSMPYQLRQSVQRRKHELNTELIEKTQSAVKIPNDHLSDDILENAWNVEMNNLKKDWETMKSRALIDKRKVTTTGDHKCPSCGNEHGSGVCCWDCGQSSLYYWVDAQTKTSICDGCKETAVITSVCCYSCKTTLNARVVPIN